MSSSKCARCEQTVYPVEGLRCLDKIWHKGCFKCQECNMTLNLKNYKGFEKKPYCNAHCPQAKATTVADTPEIRRLAENTRIQSQAKYHEDFEKSKGKGFTTIVDDPEMLRIKNTSKIISNVAYHGELERKKQMEEKRGLSGPEEVAFNNNNNNNNGQHQNGMHHSQAQGDFSSQPAGNLSSQGHYQPQGQQQMQQQQQQKKLQQKQQQLQLQKQQHLKHQQQQLIKQQQQQQQQMLYAQDHNGQANHNRQSQQLDGHPMQQQPAAKHMPQQPQQYPLGHPNHHQQQQLIMRQQQQHHQMMMQQQQLQRQSLDTNLPPIWQQTNKSLPQQQMNKHQMIPNHQQQQHQMKYMPMNDVPVGHQQSPSHMMGGPHLMNSSQLSGVPNGQRVAPNAVIGSQQMIHNYNQHQQGQMNGPMPKQPQQHYIGGPQPRQIIHPSQIQPINNQMRPNSQQMVPMQLQPQQMPRRVFRAMYDYVANDVDEVSFFENDILIDCVNVDGNWLIGKVARSGQTGMLPANYVAEFSTN